MCSLSRSLGAARFNSDASVCLAGLERLGPNLPVQTPTKYGMVVNLQGSQSAWSHGATRFDSHRYRSDRIRRGHADLRPHPLPPPRRSRYAFDPIELEVGAVGDQTAGRNEIVGGIDRRQLVTQRQRADKLTMQRGQPAGRHDETAISSFQGRM